MARLVKQCYRCPECNHERFIRRRIYALVEIGSSGSYIPSEQPNELVCQNCGLVVPPSNYTALPD